MALGGAAAGLGTGIGTLFAALGRQKLQAPNKGLPESQVTPSRINSTTSGVATLFGC